MKNTLKKRSNSQDGVALLVAMITLLLISAVAVAMIVASGAESSINGNYRSSSSAYYAALAGLEEGRGRLLPTSSNTILGVQNIPTFGNVMAVNQVAYIANPNTAAGETLTNVLTTYPDTQYDAEFGSGKLAAAAKTNPPIQSLSGTNAAGIPGPMYKWVRINPVTEFSLKMDVDNNGTLDPNNVLYYETANTPPSLTQIASSTAYQVFEITAFAMLPNGTEKLMQYLVTPQVYGMNFPSALTLAGTVGAYAGASSNPYKMNGADGSGNPPLVPGCTNNQPAVDAIGVSAASDAAVVTAGIPHNRINNYTGAGGNTPNVNPVPLTSVFSSTSALDQLVTNIKQNANVVIPNPPNPQNYNNSGTTYNFGQSGPGYTWPANMGPNNPQTIYVDGSFDLGPNTGYGLLVVTGNFQYHGNSGWKGIILVVGDGTTTFLGNGGGNGEFDGAIFVATTRDINGVQLPNFGVVNYDITGGGGNGVYYNSCWIKQVQQPPTYKVLSFREIQYTD
jgi:Tfp pilus assembly protein PilX